jgi:hypothetical protein
VFIAQKHVLDSNFVDIQLGHFGHGQRVVLQSKKIIGGDHPHPIYVFDIRYFIFYHATKTTCGHTDGRGG